MSDVDVTLTEYTVEVVDNIDETTIILSGSTVSNVYITDASELTTSHIENVNNPHEVTAAQVGLGNVLNAEQLLASQLETTLTPTASGSIPTSKAVADYVASASPAPTANTIVTLINASAEVIADANIAASIARDTEVSNAISQATASLVNTNDSRLSDARTPTAHTQAASTITDFDTEVSNNTDVAANTSARHTHANTAVLNAISGSGSGEIITAAERAKLAAIEAGATGDLSASEIITLINNSAGIIDDDNIASTLSRTSHNHSGTYEPVISTKKTAFNVDFGSTSGTACQGNDSRLSDARTPVAHTQAASTITDFDTEVSNNTDVAANTSARHSHANASTLSSITDAGSGVIISTAERSKLAGIETGATADMTASEILTAIKTVDGSTSGLDADFVDGYESTAFPKLAHTNNFTGKININASKYTAGGNYPFVYAQNGPSLKLQANEIHEYFGNSLWFADKYLTTNFTNVTTGTNVFRTGDTFATITNTTDSIIEVLGTLSSDTNVGAQRIYIQFHGNVTAHLLVELKRADDSWVQLADENISVLGKEYWFSQPLTNVASYPTYWFLKGFRITISNMVEATSYLKQVGIFSYVGMNASPNMERIGGTFLGNVNWISGTQPTVNGTSLVLTTDGRLSNARTPTSHASTHLSNGADAIASATTSVGGLMSAADKTKLDAIESGATGDLTGSEIITLINGTAGVIDDDNIASTLSRTSHVHGNVSAAGAIGSTANLPLITGTAGIVQAGSFGTGAYTFCQGNDSRLSDARTPTSHVHGNITNAGAIGSTTNLPIITTTGGVLTTGSFGTGANTFCVGNDSRLSDARTPTAHAASHLGGSDSLGLGTAAFKAAGSANGVAELDATGKVPSAQLPSFVDDVVESADFASLPVTGESGKIYVTLDTNKTYRWSGSAYAEISASLALGETSTTAYRGDRGATAYSHAIATGNAHNLTASDIVGIINAGASLIDDDNIASSIARDSEVTNAISTHAGNATAHHSNANDPTSGQKAALAGTSGTVSDSNRYVTNADSRMTDARTPLSHAHGNITNTGYLGSTANLPLITGTSGIIQAGSFGTGAYTFCQGNDSRLSDARTPTSHLHGNITNAGAIGSTANLPVITTTNGVLTVGSFGSSANTFCVGNDSRLSDSRTPTSHNNTAHSETYITTAGVTYEALNANSDVGTGSSQVAAGNHTHSEYAASATVSDLVDAMSALDIIVADHTEDTTIHLTSAAITYEALNTNGDIGTTSGTLCAGNDTRLVDNAKQADRPFVFQTGHTAWANGLSNEEIGRIQLQTGETLYIKRVEIQIKGGGTSSSLSVNAYDSTNTTQIASQTAGGVNTTGGNSGSAALVLIRLTNSVGSTQNASVYISGWIRS